jgi:hypothetical protein
MHHTEQLACDAPVVQRWPVAVREVGVGNCFGSIGRNSRSIKQASHPCQHTATLQATKPHSPHATTAYHC